MTDVQFFRVPRLDPMPTRRLVGAYVTEIKYEFLRLLRLPAFSIPAVLLPTALFLILSLYNGTGSPFLLATGVVFGSIAPGLFGVGISVATDRAAGLLVLKRAFPAPGGSYLLAKLIMAVGFAAMITLVQMSIALAFHTPLTLGTAASLLAIGSFGVLPFCALGMLLGLVIAPQAAPAIVNLLYISMCVLSGIWIPLSRLPKAVQTLANIWPTYHLTQLAHVAATGTGTGNPVIHMAVLLFTTVVLFLTATARLRRA